MKHVLFVQLPIPPAGPIPIRGNVPLAAGYLVMFARTLGLDRDYAFSILPPAISNNYSEAGLVREILSRDPDFVAFTCYLWNVERSLWIAAELKRQKPDLKIVIGGPEVTGDNQWVLNHPAIDFACCGEGEQTFAQLLIDIRDHKGPRPGTPGLFIRGKTLGKPPFRTPLPNIDVVSSPYLAGILDAGEERLLLLETIRGCVFKCKFCYYPKSYDDLYFVSKDKIIANLEHARERGVTEVVLLDPTLNQRKDFDGFLRLLAECNPDHQWTYFGELRGEGIKEETAKLLRAANFTEVEVGLQSIDPHAQSLMDRKNSMKAFERGATAMMSAGLKVKVDLIIGLPGDTVESVRSGLHYLHRTGLYHDVQVFQLAILPGTAFREEAESLGLKFQPRPPYYVLQTPTFDVAAMTDLMAEAQELFGCEFDAPPPPKLSFPPQNNIVEFARFDLDRDESELPAPHLRSQAFTIWFSASSFDNQMNRCREVIRQILEDNPHTSLQVVIEPKSNVSAVPPGFVENLHAEAFSKPSYLDRFYSMQPGRARGAKRIVVVADHADRAAVEADWLDEVGSFATIVWTGGPETVSDGWANYEETAAACG